jgi:transposase
VNAKGYNPNHSFDEQIRLMYIFSAQRKQPVYYKLINGNITDVTSMKQCVEELGIEKVVFIADKGFYSKKNVEELKNNKLCYIIPLYRNNSLIDYSILLKANYKKEIENFFLYQGRIIWYYQYEREGKKLITYLDEKLRAEEEQDYLIRVETHPEEYTQEKFFDKIAHFGTLTLINDLPIEHSASQLYEAYKQRNEIEIMFDAYKNVMDADKMYMQNRYVLEGWLTANFIAMIAYYRLFQRLKQAKLLTKYSPKDIVEISKSIFQTNINNKWRRSEITAKITAVFKKIEIEYLN